MSADSHQGAVDQASRLAFNPIVLAANVKLQRPLSRCGTGPALVVILPDPGVSVPAPKKSLDPVPLQKWAEEGFAVVELTISKVASPPDQDVLNARDAFERGIEALKVLPECTFNDKVGVIVYDLGLDFHIVTTVELWRTIWGIPEIAAVSSFTKPITLPASDSDQPTHEAPLIIHSVKKRASGVTPTSHIIHIYESAPSTNFVLPSHEHYQAGLASIAHSRNLGFLKKHLGGPNFDLEAIWDEHTMYEFEEKNVEKTMATMVEAPYVNHVPTMTGGIGRADLTAFYGDHFIFNNPPDTKLDLVSRTIGIDRIVDEFIFSFTHTTVIDWLIPGIPPTQKPVRVPFTAIVNIRGDRLYHEHIAWDQASVLRQLGLLPEYLPFPYPLPDGRVPGEGKRFEYRVPTVGANTSLKMADPESVPSNELIGDGLAIREVDDI